MSEEVSKEEIKVGYKEINPLNQEEAIGGDKKLFSEIQKETVSIKIPEKLKKYLLNTVYLLITTTMITGGVWGVIKAGEEGQLPKIGNWDTQKTYEQHAEGFRILFGFEEIQKDVNNKLTKLLDLNVSKKMNFGSGKSGGGGASGSFEKEGNVNFDGGVSGGGGASGKF